MDKKQKGTGTKIIRCAFLITVPQWYHITSAFAYGLSVRNTAGISMSNHTGNNVTNVSYGVPASALAASSTVTSSR